MNSILSKSLANTNCNIASLLLLAIALVAHTALHELVLTLPPRNPSKIIHALAIDLEHSVYKSINQTHSETAFCYSSDFVPSMACMRTMSALSFAAA